MNKYRYKGPVYKFDKYLEDSGVIETMAPTKKKAKSNIEFRLKQRLNLTKDTKIFIHYDKIMLIENDE
jgi:hypothetical protein